MTYPIIGPTLRSGIGQHAHKYTECVPDARYYDFWRELDAVPACDEAFLFVIPHGSFVERIESLKKRVKKLICMTVCETETVHEDYGKLCGMFEKMAVPSEFCKRVLEKQFPDTEFKVIRAHIPPPKPKPYTFYTIGNIMDQRKGFRAILESFVRLNAEDSRLLVKATCNRDVEINVPRVEVINGLVSDEEMERIHARGDCYVSFPNSEGVGMGCCEAAIRDKVVITTEFGGSAEYLADTPYLIECDTQELDADDFLFKKGMRWGKPKIEQLQRFMRECYEKRATRADHPTTRRLTSRDTALADFKSF